MSIQRRAPHEWIAALKLVVTLACVTRYGYFRDELYYLACARHLAWGYVDHPPFSIAVLAVVRGILGESLYALRIVPTLCGAAFVLVTARLARVMGAGRAGQALAALCVLCTPTYLGTHHVYSMNAIDGVIWAISTLIFACILQASTADAPSDLARRLPRLWLTLGVVLGLGLLNKASVLWLTGGAFVGLVLGPARRELRTRWPWIAVGLAFAIALPHVLWQVSHGWPVREFMRHATEDKMADVSIGGFFAGQALGMGPVVAGVSIVGLGALLRASTLRTLRPLGIAFVAVLLLLLGNGKSRADYLAVAYAPLIAAGACTLERFTRERRAMMWLVGAAACAMATLALPFALPVLSLDSFVAYERALGVTPKSEEKKDMGLLPQFYADSVGWKEMSDVVASATATLSTEERTQTVVLANNYGEAGALEMFGAGRLPPIASAHNNYWLWGPQRPDAQIVVRLLQDAPDLGDYLATRYERCDKAATFESEWVMPYENHLGVWICRGPREPLGSRWEKMKHYD